MEKLTRFERARIIGARALQLSFGAPPLIKQKADMDSIDTAILEFEKKLVPLVVLRQFPNGGIKRIMFS